MRRILLVVSALLSVNLFANTVKRFELKTKPFGLTYGRYEVEGNYRLDNNWTVGAHAGYGYTSDSRVKNTKERFNKLIKEAKHEDSIKTVDTLNNLVDLDPDITLLYDCSVEEGLKRAKARAKLDRFEDEAIAFHERIHAAYQSLTKTYPKRFHIIDADASIDVVQDQTLEHLSPYIKGL